MNFEPINQTSLPEFALLKKKIKENPLTILIVSSSLSPFIRKGSQVIVESHDFEKLSPFDIIVFWNKTALICHILYKFENGLALTKGLESKEFDPLVERKMYLGKVTNVRFNWFQKFLLKRQFKNAWISKEN